MTTPKATPAMTMRSDRLVWDRRRAGSLLVIVLALAGAILAPGCGPGRRVRPSPGAAKILTVPAIERMVQMRTPTSVILAEIQRSGTVYNLTEQQVRDLRAVGMPADVIRQMQVTYQHALRQNPKLASTGRYWTQVDNYWYGGIPVGWPRDWVVGAPAVGKAKR